MFESNRENEMLMPRHQKRMQQRNINLQKKIVLMNNLNSLRHNIFKKYFSCFDW